MTKEIKAFAAAQHAMGFIQAAIADLPDRMRSRSEEALGWINRSLETLLELAEKPEVVVPEEEPSPIWHFAGVRGLYAALPEPGMLVLTWSSEPRASSPLQILKCSFQLPDEVIWRDESNAIFRGQVDYWMPIPPIPPNEQE